MPVLLVRFPVGMTKTTTWRYYVAHPLFQLFDFREPSHFLAVKNLLFIDANGVPTIDLARFQQHPFQLIVEGG